MNVVLNATVDYVVSGKSYLDKVKAEVGVCVIKEQILFIEVCQRSCDRSR